MMINTWKSLENGVESIFAIARVCKFEVFELEKRSTLDKRSETYRAL